MVFSNPVVAVWAAPAETKATLGSDGLCNVVPLARRRCAAIGVHPNRAAVTDARCNKMQKSQPGRGWVEGDRNLRMLASHAG